MYRTKLFLAILSLIPLGLLAQGDDNLLMQYNKGPSDASLYYRWNFSIHGLGVRMNTPLDFTRPRLSWGAGFLVQRKSNKTFAFATGFSFLNIHYRYQREDLDTKDLLAYWRIPVLLRVSPSDRLIFEIGPTYNLLNKAENSQIVRYTTENRPPFIITTGHYSYGKGHFKDAFGIVTAVSYRFWKSVSARLEYTQIKTIDDPFTDQSNTFRGVNLGLEWSLFNPSKPSKYAIR